MATETERIRIRMEAYDHRSLDASAREIVEHARKTNARVSGPVPMLAHLLQDPSLTREDFDKIKKLIAEAEERLSED